MKTSVCQSSRFRTCLIRATIALVAVLLLAVRTSAQPIQSAPEERIKAAYLYNFAAYVEWPEGTLDAADSSLTVGIVGDESLADELERIVAGRSVHGRRLEVRRVAAADSLAGLHILFIASNEAETLTQLVAEAQPNSILVVTESDDALASGSVINFRLIDQRVRFEVSLDAADKSRLSISSRLLAVAEHVQARSGG